MSFTLTPSSIPNWLTALLAGAALLATMFGGYIHNDKALSERVSKLETHQQDDTSRLDRIENKIDQLVTWALGK